MAEILTNSDLNLAILKWPDKNVLGTLDYLELFTGQERPRRQLYDFITQSKRGSVAYISEPLGAGKSALVSMVRDDLRKSGFASFEESGRIASTHMHKISSFEIFYANKGWGGDKLPSNYQPVTPKVLFLEEFDIKQRFKDLQHDMEIASLFLGRDVPVIVLTGDRSLLNP